MLNGFASAPAVTAAIQSVWAQGKRDSADNAAATARAGHDVDPTPTSASLEADAMSDFLFSGVNSQPGLNWLPGVAIEPRLVMDRHWGRLYNQLYRNSALLGVGVDVNSAIELTAAVQPLWAVTPWWCWTGLGKLRAGTNGALECKICFAGFLRARRSIAP